MPRYLCPLLCGLLAAAAFADGPTKPGEPTAKVKKHLGERALHVLAKPTRLELFEIGVPRGGKIEHRVGRWPAKGPGLEVKQAVALKLAAVLRDEQTYFGDGLPADPFFPTHAFRLWRDKESLDVIFNARSGLFQVHVHDAEGKVIKELRINPYLRRLRDLQQEALKERRER